MSRLHVITGTRHEARILRTAAGDAGLDIPVHAAAGRKEAVTSIFRTIAKGDIVLSMGYAAGLAGDIAPGTVILATLCLAEEGGGALTPDPDLQARLAAAQFAPPVQDGPVCTVRGELITAVEKRAAHEKTDALAADMESAWVLEAAGKAGVRAAVLRVVLDGVDFELPHALKGTMKADGRMNWSVLLARMAARPGDTGRMMALAKLEKKTAKRLGRVAFLAFRALG